MNESNGSSESCRETKGGKVFFSIFALFSRCAGFSIETKHSKDDESGCNLSEDVESSLNVQDLTNDTFSVDKSSFLPLSRMRSRGGK